MSAVLIALTAFCTDAKSDVMLGAYLAGDGWSPSLIKSSSDAFSQSLAYINIFSGFSHDWRLLKHQCTNIRRNDMVPMISWMPIDSTRRNTNILPEIVDGQWDEYIHQWASDLKFWLDGANNPASQRVLLRFGHEFNGNWYSYGNDPEHFVLAWRHVHNLLKQAGVNDRVEWVWSANYIDIDDYRDMTRYYPGFDYVNWTSLDGYNWGSNYRWTRWKSFTETFSDAYQLLVDNYPTKPILIAEVASTEPADQPDPDKGQNGDDSDAGEDRTSWYADMLIDLKTQFPAIRALTLFNINKELSWSITGNDSTGLQAFNNGLSDNYFTPDYLTTLRDSDQPLGCPCLLYTSPSPRDS